MGRPRQARISSSVIFNSCRCITFLICRDKWKNTCFNSCSLRKYVRAVSSVTTLPVCYRNAPWHSNAHSQLTKNAFSYHDAVTLILHV